MAKIDGVERVLVGRFVNSEIVIAPEGAPTCILWMDERHLDGGGPVYRA